MNTAQIFCCCPTSACNRPLRAPPGIRFQGIMALAAAEARRWAASQIAQVIPTAFNDAIVEIRLMTTRHILARISLVSAVALFLCSVTILLLQSAVESRSRNYLASEIPKLAAELSKMPGVAIQRIDNMNPDELEIRVTLSIAGKGTVTLLNPSHERFVNNEPLFTLAIGDCILRNEPSQRHYIPAIDLVDRYDEIYEQARNENWCVK